MLSKLSEFVLKTEKKKKQDNFSDPIGWFLPCFLISLKKVSKLREFDLFSFVLSINSLFWALFSEKCIKSEFMHKKKKSANGFKKTFFC